MLGGIVEPGLELCEGFSSDKMIEVEDILFRAIRLPHAPDVDSHPSASNHVAQSWAKQLPRGFTAGN